MPIIVVTIVYLIGLFTNHRGNLSDFALSPLAGAPDCWCGCRQFSRVPAEPYYFRHYREQRVLLLLGYLRVQEELRDSAHAYSERLAAKTYADQLFLGQQEFATSSAKICTWRVSRKSTSTRVCSAIA